MRRGDGPVPWLLARAGMQDPIPARPGRGGDRRAEAVPLRSAKETRGPRAPRRRPGDAEGLALSRGINSLRRLESRRTTASPPATPKHVADRVCDRGENRGGLHAGIRAARTEGVRVDAECNRQIRDVTRKGAREGLDRMIAAGSTGSAALHRSFVALSA
jgi:hypothetical protein